MEQKQTSHTPMWGADIEPERRPGVPMESDPRPLAGTHGREHASQPASELPLKAEQRPVTQVFSTAMPPKGLSGWLRRFAYTQPDHRARHWMTLLFADRVDVLEHGSGRKFVGFSFGLLAGAMAFLLRRRPVES
jgi:hypothetical protein